MAHTFTFRPGRKHAQPARPALRAAAYRTAAAPPPPTADWLSQVTVPWGMMGNAEVGDCTCAAAGHKILGDTAYGQGAPFVVPDSAILATYSAVTGYDPDDPATDQGALCQDVLEYWRTHGIAGHQILAYARVDVSDLAEVRWAISTFGQVYTGFNVPDSAETQFNAGQPWSVVPGARILGGHCVTVGAYDAAGFDAITWGERQKMDEAFFQHYFDEVWVVIDQDFVNRQTGKDAAGVDLYALGEDFAALTGQHNPIAPPAGV